MGAGPAAKGFQKKFLEAELRARNRAHQPIDRKAAGKGPRPVKGRADMRDKGFERVGDPALRGMPEVKRAWGFNNGLKRRLSGFGGYEEGSCADG